MCPLGKNKTSPVSQRRLSQPWSAAVDAPVKPAQTHTCPIPDDRAELGAEEHIHVVQDELHHHRLDPYLHEGGRATEARRLDLLGPAKGHKVREQLLLGMWGAAGPGAQAEKDAEQFLG